MNQFKNNQPDLTRLISKLRIKIKPRYKNMKNPEGPEGRLKMISYVLTALFKYERIELSFVRAEEARGYAERLISEAIRHGDSHKPTMDIADFYLREKALVHKLFKVLAPRFADYQSSYTSLFKAPLAYPNTWFSTSVLELKGNPFPPLIFDGSRNKNLIHNVLLDEARKEYKKTKQAEIIAKISSCEKKSSKIAADCKKEDVLSKAAAEVSEGEQLLKFTSENQSSDSSAESESNLNETPENNPVVV